MSKCKFVLGAFLGAVVGWTVGVLTAPKSGKATRADIKVKAEAIKRETTKSLTSAEDNLNEFSDDMKAKAVKAVEVARDKGDEIKSLTETAIDGAKKGFNRKI
jgi:gas vesicle protein